MPLTLQTIRGETDTETAEPAEEPAAEPETETGDGEAGDEEPEAG